MTCAEAADLIGPYTDNELPEGVRRRVETHLLGCATCAWDAQTFTITRERLRGDLGDVVASDAFRARTLARLVRDNAHLTAANPPETEPAQYQLPIRFSPQSTQRSQSLGQSVL